METQVCNKCGNEKTVDNFFFRNKEKNIIHKHCKGCCGQSRRSKDHYEKYKPAYIQRAKERGIKVREDNRIKLIEYFKDHPCIVCGESNPVVLDFDHKEQSEKTKEICKMISSYKWDTILAEINKCDVLCANHHRIRTSKQLGWFYEKLGQKV